MHPVSRATGGEYSQHREIPLQLGFMPKGGQLNIIGHWNVFHGVRECDMLLRDSITNKSTRQMDARNDSQEGVGQNDLT